MARFSWIRRKRTPRSVDRPLEPKNEHALFTPLLPSIVARMRTESSIGLIAPWFMESLKTPGDVCEFGCFKGTMSIKFAFLIKAHGYPKTVFAFDTFEGFQMNDPAGGPTVIGCYSDNDGAYDELQKWSSVIPVKPVKGDARETCQNLTEPLSFVWLDLDFDVLLDPVFRTIWPLLTENTLIGVDDVYRPETPGVGPWVDRLVADGCLIEVANYPAAFIRFFRVNKGVASPLPSP